MIAMCTNCSKKIADNNEFTWHTPNIGGGCDKSEPSPTYLKCPECDLMLGFYEDNKVVIFDENKV